jgi:hypothetical protein
VADGEAPGVGLAVAAEEGATVPDGTDAGAQATSARTIAKAAAFLGIRAAFGGASARLKGRMAPSAVGGRGGP